MAPDRKTGPDTVEKTSIDDSVAQEAAGPAVEAVGLGVEVEPVAQPLAAASGAGADASEDHLIAAPSPVVPRNLLFVYLGDGASPPRHTSRRETLMSVQRPSVKRFPEPPSAVLKTHSEQMFRISTRLNQVLCNEVNQCGDTLTPAYMKQLEKKAKLYISVNSQLMESALASLCSQYDYQKTLTGENNGYIRSLVEQLDSVIADLEALEQALTQLKAHSVFNRSIGESQGIQNELGLRSLNHSIETLSVNQSIANQFKSDLLDSAKRLDFATGKYQFPKPSKPKLVLVKDTSQSMDHIRGMVRDEVTEEKITSLSKWSYPDLLKVVVKQLVAELPAETQLTVRQNILFMQSEIMKAVNAGDMLLAKEIQLEGKKSIRHFQLPAALGQVLDLNCSRRNLEKLFIEAPYIREQIDIVVSETVDHIDPDLIKALPDIRQQQQLPEVMCTKKPVNKGAQDAVGFSPTADPCTPGVSPEQGTSPTPGFRRRR